MKGVKKSPYPFGLKENMEGGNRAKKLALFILPYDIECFWEYFWENCSKCFINVDFNRVPGFMIFPISTFLGK